MITPDGWLDWAIRLPGPLNKNLNPGVNPVRGIFMHSAEGYAGTLLDPNSQWGYRGNHSWHLTNLFDGTVYQHYPFTARCHHATAANNSYVGVENEGDAPKESSLTEPQINSAVRFIREISEWKGWQAKRPLSQFDISHTLWEHNEVVRIGGSASSCPSGRIPWTEILNRLTIPPVKEEYGLKVHFTEATWFRGRDFAGSNTIYTMQARSDFKLPDNAKAVVLQALYRHGAAEFYHSGTDAPGIKQGDSVMVILSEEGTCNFQTLGSRTLFNKILCLGYFT